MPFLIEGSDPGITYEHRYIPNKSLYPDQTFISYQAMAVNCPLIFEERHWEDRIVPYTHTFVKIHWDVLAYFDVMLEESQSPL
jgi:hypothetical protein